MRPTLLFSCLIVFSFNTNAQQKQKDTTKTLNEVIISANSLLGSKFEAKNRTGSATFITPQELKKFGHTDINRVLKNVPGVNIYEEDGFGLRPNISLRGTSGERSSKITLMEDGVLIAPAPYSAPAAYYFPSIARMNAVEILKGSSQIQYGPFTTGGAINFLSVPTPTKNYGTFQANYGSFESRRIFSEAGVKAKNAGFVIQYMNFGSKGFKELAKGGNTGFDKNDLVAKLHLTTNKDKKIVNSLDLKLQYADEVSNETYLGLTEEDFNKNAFLRYASSEKDKMTNDHLQFTATHTLKIGNFMRITTTAYQNKFARNWYKLDKVKFGTQNLGINDILINPSLYNNHFAIINGSVNSADNALSVKANNRNYLSKGIQTKFDYHFSTDELIHDIEIGARYHYDEEDRFQWVDGYNILNGSMNLTNSGIGGSDTNKIASAKAFSAHAMYKLKYNKLTITPGVRLETIDLYNEDFGKTDPTRSGNNLKTDDNFVRVWLPGIGANYKFSENISFFGGVHKGFAPPTNKKGQIAESSVNIEVGSRFNHNQLSGELILFYNDYSNMLGSDLAANGGTGSLDQFNAGKVNVKGLEFLLNYNLLSAENNLVLPVTLGYTYTDTEFLSSFGSSDELWGIVTKGDELPYISKHQANGSIALEHKKFDISFSAKYNGAFRTKAGKGSIPNNLKVGDNFILDLGSRYHLNQWISFTATINNLLDKTYLVSRTPAGLRPGMPFSFSGGMILNLL
ncbi:TonB-dependent receptor family protein [Flavobacterium luminosum]|uniref:TonB-dependent receptor n=1 Tax=Flavobacterium luminosum TaxID=2949086 RepID=A0ABT0TMW9_9FLAO|nr:TonB-dependent receptor [Flavobacterium sp. HXWNR70]MCL9808835.1 TonB-dependent receptor [Flavobacterium sp. HXWNR70]